MVAVVVAAVAVGFALVLPPRVGAAAAEGGEGHVGLVAFLGRFHVLALHLPIGALVAAVTVESYGVLRGERARDRLGPALDALVPFLLGSAAVAFVLGVLLARDGGHPAHLVALHRGTTLASLVGCAAVAIAWVHAREDAGRRGGFRGLLLVTAGLMSVGAHFGGSLTHGESFLVEAAPPGLRAALGGVEPRKETATPVVAKVDAGAADPRVFADVVAPLLREHCVDCHGPKKSKGRLRLDTLEAMREGGKHGPAIIAKDAGKSPIVARMRLPVDDEEHMPPADPQRAAPPPEMVELLGLWIERGADPELRVKDLLVPDGARKLLERAASKPGAATMTTTLDEVSKAPRPTSTASTAIRQDASKAPGLGSAASEPERSAESPRGAREPAAPMAAGEVPVFATRILPLLEARCGACHANGKSKGGLRTDSFAALTAGGDEGPAIVPGRRGQGTLLVRLRLPLDRKEHMPPRAQPQLTPGELALLAWWLGEGAPERVAAVPAFAMGALPARASANADANAHANADANAHANARPGASPNAEPLPKADLHGAAHFREVVAPMLARRCGACHAGADPSSGTRFDDAALLLRKKHVVPGHPERSPILQRARLPLQDPDHMPPSDEPQPTAAELAALGAWIGEGAAIDDDGKAAAEPEAAKPPTSPAVAAARVTPRAGGCGACTTGEGSATSGALPAALSVVVALVGAVRRRRRVS